MTRPNLPRTLAAAALCLTLAAHAAPVFLIDATTDGLAPDASLANVGFSLSYEDFNFDHQFSLNELLAFTGVSTANGDYFDTLLGLPTLAGISGNGSDWRFADSNGLLPTYTANAAAFTPFSSGPLAGSVPEPGALALCLAGLAGLGLTRRRVRPVARRSAA